jgi:hypothetical protein
VSELSIKAESGEQRMSDYRGIAKYSRQEFLRLSTRGAGALALLCAAPEIGSAQTAPDAAAVKAAYDRPIHCDLREFVKWIVDEYEPSVRLPGGAGRYAGAPGQTAPKLYGIADMACVLYTIGALDPSAKERDEWKDALEAFQNPKTGWFREEDSGLAPEHNTAFALGAMQLLDLTPRYAVTMDAKYQDMRAYFNTLDWRTNVYGESHKGAGIGVIFELVPALRSPAWFAEYFAACEGYFDANNGLMGRDKPASGDIDQIGGTFHYSFLYEYFNRQMPYPEKRIDTVLGLQGSDGYWSDSNYLWMTLDAMYLMTRTLRYRPYRFEDVKGSVRRLMSTLEQAVYSAEGRKKAFATGQGVHLLTSATAIAAEAQQFLGEDEVMTDWPLKLVLDRRPFI